MAEYVDLKTLRPNSHHQESSPLLRVPHKMEIANTVSSTAAIPPRDYRFKLTLLCLCLILFLSAIEFTSVSTALPTIVNDLNGDQFIWVASSYALSSAAVIPLIGDLAEIFGRKPTTLLVIFCFGLGSAICGAAQNLNTLIAGRVIQGLGGGAIVVMTNIVLADTVPLQERGGYGGFFSLYIIYYVRCFVLTAYQHCF